MDRTKFTSPGQRDPVRRGQKWSLLDKDTNDFLPEEIEIIDILMVKEGNEKVQKCKIKEIGYRRYSSICSFGQRIKSDEITQFMLAGDILTYYEQI